MTRTTSCSGAPCGALDCPRCHPELAVEVECAECGDYVPKYAAVRCRRCNEWMCEDCWHERGGVCEACRSEEAEEAAT